MIKIKDLAFAYKEGDFSLKIPELELPQNKAIAIVGPSGSGKSTLMKIIAGEIATQGGSITVNEQEINNFSDSQRRHFRLNQIGMILQDSALLEYLNLQDNICLAAKLQNKKYDAERLKKITESCGIAKLMNKKPAFASEGEKQRAAICRALLTNPEIILADEPTSSLDRQNSLAATGLLIEQCKEHETTLVMITHDDSQLEFFDEVIDITKINGASHA